MRLLRSLCFVLPVVAALNCTSCAYEGDEFPIPVSPEASNPTPDPDPEPNPNPNPQNSGFVRGADISWLTEMENDGRKFYADQSMTKEVEGTQLMKDMGLTAIRLRVWVDPANKNDGYITESKDKKSYCDKADLIVKAKRAQDLGLDVMVDFHYSNSWADPIKQYIPYDWRNYTYAQMKEAVKNHTTEVLTALKDAGVTNVKWVQVGNETHSGMLCYQYKKSDPVAAGGYYAKYPAQYAGFIDTGYEAVKSIFPEALVIVHHDKSTNYSLVKSNLTALKNNNARYDLVGLSLYPCEVDKDYFTVASTTESNINTAMKTVGQINTDFGKESMFVEVGLKMWPEKNITTSTKYMESIITKAQSTDHCTGIIYWEPMGWWWYDYNMGAFNVGDSNGKKLYPNDIFKAFCK